jgi:hypothetical protein
MALSVALVLPLATGAIKLWPVSIAQTRLAITASRSAWPVSLPATATVRLEHGASMSGRLTKFTSSAVTLAVGRQTQSVALAKVSTIEFVQPNDLWITLPNRLRQQVRPIRGLSQLIDAVPSSSLQVDGTREWAIVDLTPVLTEAEFAKLNRNPDVVYLLVRLEVGADGKLGLWVRPYGAQ